MNMNHWRKAALSAALFGLGLAPFATVHAQAQTYPNKPIRLIVPFTPGSATDVLGRLMAERMSAAWGQQIIVENRPGAGGTIGAAQVAKAAPDGYTLLVVSTGHVVNDKLYANIQYDTIKDFAGVAPLGLLPSVLAVSPALGVKSVRDLVAMAKAKPGQLNYGTAGVGSGAHISAEKFRYAAGIDAVHIPFKGSPEMLTETLGGRIQYTWSPLSSAIPFLRDNKLLALAVSTPARSPALPDVPTIAEAGLPGAQFNFWVAVLAPAQTPRDIVAKINAQVVATTTSPDGRQRLSNVGAEPMPMTVDQFNAFLVEEHKVLGDLMVKAGAKPL